VRNSATSCSTGSIGANNVVDPRLAAWLARLIAEHGPGEYILCVRADGTATVKRPQAPLKFEYR